MKVDDGESFASMLEGARHGALPERPREPRAPAFLRSVRRTTCRARAASGRTDGFIPDGACSARRKLAGPRTTPERFLVGLPPAGTTTSGPAVRRWWWIAAAGIGVVAVSALVTFLALGPNGDASDGLRWSGFPHTMGCTVDTSDTPTQGEVLGYPPDKARANQVTLVHPTDQSLALSVEFRQPATQTA